MFKNTFFLNITVPLVMCVILLISNSGKAQTYQWAKSMGGTGADIGYSIAVDDSGYIYTTGVFSGTADFDPGPGIFNLTSAGNYDIFISKTDNSGNLTWAKAIGSTGYDYGYDIAVDKSGNVYITGSFKDSADFDPGPGVTYIITNGNEDIFFAKYDANGDFIRAKGIGGTSDERSFAIDADSSENVYITGQIRYDSVDFDPGPDTVYLFPQGQKDIFFAKYDANGNYLWANGIGSAQDDEGYDIKVSDAGNVYVTGYFNNTADFDPGADTAGLTATGERDIFIAKYDSSGNYLWSVNTGTVSKEAANGMTLDRNENVYVTGYYDGVFSFIAFSGIYISKYNANGINSWSIVIPFSNSFSEGNNLSVDDEGNVYVTGTFRENLDFDPGIDTAYLYPQAGNNLFLAKYDSSGNYVWAFPVGVNASGNDITLNEEKSIFITGEFNGTLDFDPGDGYAPLSSNASSTDIFIAKYVQCEFDPILLTLTDIDSVGCFGHNNGSATVNASGGVPPYSYLWSDGASQTTVTVTGLYAGTYSVTVTDDRGCTSVENVTIIEADYLQQEICLITVDTSSTKNVIVWEKPVTTGIDSFRIYRELGTNNYQHIASVSYNTLSVYIDPDVNPQQTSYRYRMSVIDTCGNESDTSELHKTIHLIISTDINDNPVLNWTDYEGFPVIEYNILRDSTELNQWQIIGTVGFGITSFTDLSPVQNSRYVVEVVPPDTCTATNKADDYNSCRSNTSIAVTTGIDKFETQSLKVKVYPNPGKGLFTVEMMNDEYKMMNAECRIFNMLGKKILTFIIHHPSSIIDLKDQPAGIYHLQIITDRGIANMKVVVE